MSTIRTSGRQAGLAVMMVGMGFSFGVWSSTILSAVEPADRASRAAATKASAKEEKMERKLDDILAKQEAILQKLDEQFASLMEELRIVKIRATQGGS